MGVVIPMRPKPIVPHEDDDDYEDDDEWEPAA